MLFENVAIAGLAHVDAPHRLSSADINLRLKPTMDRLGIRTDVLGDVAGIHSRRLWDVGVEASDVATQAAEMAPPYRSPMFLMSATFESINRR